MRSLWKIAALVGLVFLAFSCSKDDDPSDNDFFVGTYKGMIAHKDKDGDKDTYEDGKITVVKVASKTKYNFEFSDGIPNLNGVEFRESGDNVLVNVDFEDGVQFVQIDASTLRIHYSKDGETWEANTTR